MSWLGIQSDVLVYEMKEEVGQSVVSEQWLRPGLVDLFKIKVTPLLLILDPGLARLQTMRHYEWDLAKMHQTFKPILKPRSYSTFYNYKKLC